MEEGWSIKRLHRRILLVEHLSAGECRSPRLPSGRSREPALVAVQSSAARHGSDARLDARRFGASRSDAIRPAGRHRRRSSVPAPDGLRPGRSAAPARDFPRVRFREPRPIGRTPARKRPCPQQALFAMNSPVRHRASASRWRRGPKLPANVAARPDRGLVSGRLRPPARRGGNRPGRAFRRRGGRRTRIEFETRPVGAISPRCCCCRTSSCLLGLTIVKRVDSPICSRLRFGQSLTDGRRPLNCTSLMPSSTLHGSPPGHSAIATRHRAWGCSAWSALLRRLPGCLGAAVGPRSRRNSGRRAIGEPAIR